MCNGEEIRHGTSKEESNRGSVDLSWAKFGFYFKLCIENPFAPACTASLKAHTSEEYTFLSLLLPPSLPHTHIDIHTYTGVHSGSPTQPLPDTHTHTHVLVVTHAQCCQERCRWTTAIS